jgi:coenzyme F420 hydrogenase subunit beta
LSGLCIYLLETKKVDFVAQIAVSPSDPVKNELQLSRTREDVLRAAGSRYGPSAPLRKLRKLLATRERFAFVGKPCDAVALRAFIRMFPEVRPQIPYVLSFMCAGIPSLHGTREVVEEMGGEYSSLVSFKYRGDGWPGKAVACMRNGARYEMDYNTSWGRILGKHLQFRCKICADGIGEQADVVCGDAWYGKEGYPDFTEREGRSLILSRTVIGKSLIDQAYEVGVIEKQTLDISELAQMQPYQLERKRLALARNIATWLAKGRTTRYIGLHLRQCAAQVSIVKNLRNAWGTYKRCQSEPASDDSISN